MEWKVIVHEKDNYIEVITSGLADKDGTIYMAKAISNFMRTYRITRVLIDHSNIDGVVSTAFDIYNRPKVFMLIGVILRIKIAEIILPEYVDHFRFFETVCHNQGYQLSVFQEKEKALAWLLV